MCETCGCSDEVGVRVTDLAANHHGHGHHHPAGHSHDHGQDHVHGHDHGHEPMTGTRTVVLEERVLAKNDSLAARNRAWLTHRDILALNLMSSPGSGKTTLLERTVRKLQATTPVSVIEGDQETLLDAERLQATGCRVVQINTGA